MERKYDKVMTKVTYIVAAIVIIAIIYFLFLKPYLTFKSYEKTMEEAGKKYFEINTTKLPTGKRVGTVSLRELVVNKFIKEDFEVPLTNKLCNLKESWVKVKLEDTDYKYYVYLDCDYLESKVDHDGPVIILNGEEEITTIKAEKFEDPGIKSVIDNNDGKMQIKDVHITGEVDTSKTGEYELKYQAFDSLMNETIVKRKVMVIDTIKSITKRETDKGFYPGDSEDNYIKFSNQLYRIISIEGDNVKIVSNDVIGVANYAALDKQLENYYKTLSSKSKKLIVKAKYCNDELSAKNLDTTECSRYTNEKKLYVPSISDINKIKTGEENYLIGKQLVWTSNMQKENYPYVIASYIPNSRSQIAPMISNSNMGIRPVITLKGDLIVSNGSGTSDEPYIIEKDVKPAKAGEQIKDRLPGEYINLNSGTWRIIKHEDDDTTKVIYNDVIVTDEGKLFFKDDYNDIFEFNPKKINSYAYLVNNRANEYFDISDLVTHEVEVPIYKSDILYGKESKTKKYKMKISIPNIYDLYTCDSYDEYYVLNSSQDKDKHLVVSYGTVTNIRYDARYDYAVRPVAYIKSTKSIVSGTGLNDDPYILK